MRTRKQAKRHEESLSGTDVSKEQAGHGGAAGSLHGEGSINAVSEEAVGRLLKRANSRKPLGSSRGHPRSESHYTSWESRDKMIELGNGKRKADKELLPGSNVLDHIIGDSEGNMLMKEKHFERKVQYDANELDWEEGMILFSESRDGYSHELEKDVTIEFFESPSSAKQRPPRRFSIEDKELAEVMHKVHLLCLIARGRLVDSACNDPLIQASLLSLLPLNLLKVAEISRLTANDLGPLVDWFHDSFRLRTESIDRGCFKSNLAFALETHEGTSEEIAALSVALFRALNLATRFVSNFDVASLKPDVDMPGNSSSTRLNTKISSSISAVSSPTEIHTPDHAHLSDSTDEAMHPNTTNSSRHPKIVIKKPSNKNVRRGLTVTSSIVNDKHDSTSQAGAENVGSSTTNDNEESKRKGDLEFELQLAMALSATATTTKSLDMDELHNSATSSSHVKKMKIAKTGESLFSTSRSSGAVWSRKNGAPLYWAEVYCSGEAVSGRWVHVDAANGLVNDEENVEPAAAVCKKPLRYAVAFAGNGAKDVTRRYCKQWYRIAPQRINPHWWDTVLAPLKELESGETGGMVHLEEFQENVSDVVKEVDPREPQTCKTSEGSASQRCPNHENMENRVASNQTGVSMDVQTPLKKPNLSTRNSLEDMELETRALTEPLPTNQLAYKSHHLYAIEKWLTKYQTLHPKGPIVGYCSGHPVYPRSCVQMVQTRQKWVREGLQIRENEIPAKVIKRTNKTENDEVSEAGFSEEDGEKSIELFGKWQVEPLQLPHAVNGVVPKNEYGRVDVWSEKCLPHGTVHLRLPRLAPVARRLEIDFANAMVGFEFRNGRSYPVFEGIVVCTEFRDAIMQAYAEEEERREAEERRKNEAEALSRWFQLLSSIITRHRLESSYAGSFAVNSSDPPSMPRSRAREIRDDDIEVSRWPYEDHDHEHVFSLDNQSLDEESLVRTKRCRCGFSIQVEEL